jgi:hypothetical protein
MPLAGRPSPAGIIPNEVRDLVAQRLEPRAVILDEVKDLCNQ